MRYLVRINPRAVNPLTKRIDETRVWEVEQCRSTDSERVKWHCADVNIDGVNITKIFQFPKKGEPPTEMEFYGIVARGADDAIQILTKGRHEVS